MGGTLDEHYRAKFNELFRALLETTLPIELITKLGLPPDLIESPAKPYVTQIPMEETVFDYQYIKEVG